MRCAFVASVFVARLDRDFRPDALLQRAGLAIPFLLSAVAFNAASRSLVFFKRHYAAIQVGSVCGPLRAELLPVAPAQLR